MVPGHAGWAADCDETCLISDMMSIAALIARGGHPEYFDYVERYMRNYISNLQFIVTPKFEAYYRATECAVPGRSRSRQGWRKSASSRGASSAALGLNDYGERAVWRRVRLRDVRLLRAGRACGPSIPHGAMSSTGWPESKLGPAGVYVNMCLNRDSKWGQVVSFFPDAGRLTVRVGTTFARGSSFAHRTGQIETGACVHWRKGGACSVVRGLRLFRQCRAWGRTDNRLSVDRLHP